MGKKARGIKRHIASDGRKVRAWRKGALGAEVAAVKREELRSFAVLPQRRVAGRTSGWIDNARRLRKNRGRTLCNSCQMPVLALIAVLIKRF